jgi:hypothetical protein
VIKWLTCCEKSFMIAQRIPRCEVLMAHRSFENSISHVLDGHAGFASCDLVPAIQAMPAGIWTFAAMYGGQTHLKAQEP